MTEHFTAIAGDGGSGGLEDTAATPYEADAADEHDPGTPMATVTDEHVEHIGPEECEIPQ